MALIVPGQSVANQEWARALSKHLEIECDILEFQWWGGVSKTIDLEVIKHSIGAKHHDVVIAKSIGTLFTSMALKEKLIRPKLLVFIGIPLKAIGDDEAKLIAEVQSHDELAMIVIQQSHDVRGAFKEVEAFFNGDCVSLIEIAGEDHLYSDFSDIAQVITSWLVEYKL